MAALDLCTRAEVKALLGLSTTDGEETDYDALIADLVTKASIQANDRASSRQFKDDGSGPTRKYDLGIYAATRRLRIDDASTVTAVRITDEYGGEIYPSSSLVEGTHYTLLPRNRGTYQPIEWVRFLHYAVTLDPTWIVEVTGTWGFPAIPPNLSHAVAYAVKTWLERDVRSFAQTAEAVNLEEMNKVPRILPKASLDVIDGFNTFGI